MAGVAAGGATTLLAHPTVSGLYLALVLTPLALRFLTLDTFHVAYAALTVVYGVLLYFSARDFSSLLRRYLVATHEARLADSTKSSFLANVSHELRTPLNAIIGFSEAMGMGMGGRLEAKHQEYVEDIRESGEHLLNPIEDLIDLFRVDLGRFEIDDERVVAPDALDECVRLVQQHADKKGIAINRDFPCGTLQPS